MKVWIQVTNKWTETTQDLTFGTHELQELVLTVSSSSVQTNVIWDQWEWNQINNIFL